MIQDDLSNISLDGTNTSNTSVSSDIKVTNVCDKKTKNICDNENNTSKLQKDTNVGSNVVNVNTSVDMHHSSIEKRTNKLLQ